MANSLACMDLIPVTNTDQCSLQHVCNLCPSALYLYDRQAPKVQAGHKGCDLCITWNATAH